MKETEYSTLSDGKIGELYKADRIKGNEVMVNKYNNYIYKIIYSFQNASMFSSEKEDLYQCGCVGIMEALEKYDARKSDFPSYCYNYVRKEVGKQILFLTGDSSEYYAGLHRIVMRARDEIQKEKGTVSIDDIVERTGKSRKLVRRELGIDYTKTSYEQLGDRI